MLSHYTPWRRLGGEEVYLLLFLDFGTRWGWVVSVTPRPRFSPGERTPGAHCTGGWVGPRAGLDTEARENSFRICRESNLDRPVVQSVARHYADSADSPLQRHSGHYIALTLRRLYLTSLFLRELQGGVRVLKRSNGVLLRTALTRLQPCF
jgi:hypothetical protein